MFLNAFSLKYNFSEIQSESADTVKSPNILFISIDDLKPVLGAYGNKIVSTPNLDQLANQGSIFMRHYVQVPTCGASRHSLLTGLRPTARRFLSNQAIVTELSNKEESVTPESFIHHLKRNGYYTVGIGKIGHTADGLVYGYDEEPSLKRELPHSWNELIFNNGKWKTGWNAFFGYADGENRQSMKNKVKPYEKGEVKDDGYVDGLTAELAVEKLEELENKNQPFFLGVGFFKPHLPFTAPKKYWDLYNRDSIPLSGLKDIPEDVHRRSLMGSGELNRYLLTDEKAGLNKKLSDAYTRKLIHSYYASVSYVDAQVGKILKKLKALNIDENTIVVVWGDHGWHLGDKRMWGKHTLFEESLRSALIVKAPTIKQKKGHVKTIVETVDIYPTLLELSGVPDIEHAIHGQSFVNLLEDPSTSTDEDYAFSYFNRGISLRTDRYRFTKYFREETPVLELYDHDSDPNETQNIAVQHPEVVKTLLLKLNESDHKLYN
jgi:arylsulfatase A-like enzyme